MHTHSTVTITHSVRRAYTGSLSACSVLGANVWSVVVVEALVGIREPGKKTNKKRQPLKYHEIGCFRNKLFSFFFVFVSGDRIITCVVLFSVPSTDNSWRCCHRDAYVLQQDPNSVSHTIHDSGHLFYHYHIYCCCPLMCFSSGHVLWISNTYTIL